MGIPFCAHQRSTIGGHDSSSIEIAEILQLGKRPLPTSDTPERGSIRLSTRREDDAIKDQAAKPKSPTYSRMRWNYDDANQLRIA